MDKAYVQRIDTQGMPKDLRYYFRKSHREHSRIYHRRWTTFPCMPSQMVAYIFIAPCRICFKIRICWDCSKNPARRCWIGRLQTRELGIAAAKLPVIAPEFAHIPPLFTTSQEREWADTGWRTRLRRVGCGKFGGKPASAHNEGNITTDTCTLAGKPASAHNEGNTPTDTCMLAAHRLLANVVLLMLLRGDKAIRQQQFHPLYSLPMPP
ncbi:hypothetical protein B0H16DRAFT_1695881 [Mycena metata]|uniref:Uncharacterized protein n=1 Tax=Mycena metata TaxID=1033252 RepID=A0AAD7I3K3_9AGAR|nr:hypothetical protein B0H16DRAFT_1695881 [Mycena metata]